MRRRHGQNHRPDANAESWVKDMRKCGAKVWPIGRPCDYLVRFAGRFYLFELTNPDNKYRKRDQDQIDLLKEWGAIEVRTVDEALRHVGAW